MKKYKFFTLAILVLLLFTWICPVFATDTLNESDSVPAPPELELDAYGAVLMNAYTGELLYTCNAQAQLYPASTTKIMTAYLTMKYGDPEEWITVPEGIYAGIPASASTANLKAGEEMTVYELLQCLMIVSANEAANALAIYISGSVEEFVTLMNEEAAALGCTNTHFVNTNGLHDEAHYTTAMDLALIAKAALEYDTLREICGTAKATIRETNLSEERTLKTTNYLLEGSDFPLYQYPGAFGFKTGFTTPAGCCLVAASYSTEHVLLSVVLGARKYQEGSETIVGSFIETAKLFDWGYENYDTALLYQDYLESLPIEEPEPSPSPSPTPTATPTPTPTPSPTPTPTPTPSPSPEPSPSVTPESSPAPQPEAELTTLLQAAAEALGISVEAFLVSVIVAAGVLLVLVIVIFIAILKRPPRRK